MRAKKIGGATAKWEASWRAGFWEKKKPLAAASGSKVQITRPAYGA
jgi:hypothetical protein